MIINYSYRKTINSHTSFRWPQTDILAHNNTKLFITHGGYNSIMEGQYFGVPLLGIPIYGDQFTNLDVVVHEKWAQVLHLYNFTVPVVTGTLHQMLNNPRYPKWITIKRLIGY